jgi:hypothetical protein
MMWMVVTYSASKKVELFVNILYGRALYIIANSTDLPTYLGPTDNLHSLHLLLTLQQRAVLQVNPLFKESVCVRNTQNSTAFMAMQSISDILF